MSSRNLLVARAIERASSAVKKAVAMITSAIQQDVRAVALAAMVLEADVPNKTAARKLIRDAAPTLGLSKAAAERMALDLVEPLREMRTVVRRATRFPGSPPAKRVGGRGPGDQPPDQQPQSPHQGSCHGRSQPSDLHGRHCQNMECLPWGILSLPRDGVIFRRHGAWAVVEPGLDAGPG